MPYMAKPYTARPYMAMPYMAKPDMARSYMTRPHMAKPYMARPYMAAAALRYNGRPETFFRNFTQEKRTLKNKKHAKKNRLKILYRMPYLKNRDLFSRANFVNMKNDSL